MLEFSPSLWQEGPLRREPWSSGPVSTMGRQQFTVARHTKGQRQRGQRARLHKTHAGDGRGRGTMAMWINRPKKQGKAAESQV